MKTNHSKLWPLIVLFLFALISCQEQAWYEHYEDSGKAGSEKTMMEYIKSEPQLGLFLQMLEVSGYDTLLSVSQTFTVWAPQNNAMSGIDLDDTTTVTEIISNHIARYCIGTSSTRSDKVFMLSNKLVSFEGNKFGLTNLVSSNIKVANGLLHIIDGFVPYVPNIWEYTGRIPGLDSLAAYFLSQNQREFNLLESKQIGVNADNQPIYDSSFIESNRYLTERVNLNNEDAVFTALFPNNQAWHKSFDLIKDYYKTTDADGGWTKQKSLAQAALVKDLVYLDNFKEKGIPDSLVTSSGHVIDSAKVLFQGAVSHDASNGVIYVTDSLRIPATSSWHIPLQIEAEDNNYGRASLNAKLYNRTSAGTSVSASGGRYLEVEATGTTILSKTYVDFPIPDVLSAKYDVYCLFVPESVVNRINPKPNVVNLYMSYLGPDGKLKNNVSIKKNVTIDAEDTTLVHVTQMDFPYCSVLDRNSEISDLTVKLRVENAVTASQTRLYTRTMRIDCIIFIPVED